MRMTATALTLAAALVAPALAADSYSFDARHTRPMFEVGHLGFSTQHGRFGKAAGKVVIDTAARSGNLELTVHTDSVDMGAEDWNKHLRSDEFFNVEKYPTMSFRSDQLLFDGDKVVGAAGSLTLLGVTRPLTVTVTNFRCGLHPLLPKFVCGGDVTARIWRSEFGMNKFLPAVADEVRIVVPVEAFRD